MTYDAQQPPPVPRMRRLTQEELENGTALRVTQIVRNPEPPQPVNRGDDPGPDAPPLDRLAAYRTRLATRDGFRAIIDAPLLAIIETLLVRVEQLETCIAECVAVGEDVGP